MSSIVILAAEEGGGNFLIPDATFLAELFAFLIILAIMYKYVVPPLQRSMTERQELIRKQIEDAKETKERLAAAEADYKKAKDEARAEAAKAREEGNKTRQEIIDSAKDEARREAAAVTERAEARLEVERRQVLSELRGEIGRLAVQLAERVVGESLADDERQSRVVDRFLAELENGAAEGSDRDDDSKDKDKDKAAARDRDGDGDRDKGEGADGPQGEDTDREKKKAPQEGSGAQDDDGKSDSSDREDVKASGSSAGSGESR